MFVNNTNQYHMLDMKKRINSKDEIQAISWIHESLNQNIFLL